MKNMIMKNMNMCSLNCQRQAPNDNQGNELNFNINLQENDQDKINLEENVNALFKSFVVEAVSISKTTKLYFFIYI